MSLIADHINAFVNPDESVDVQAASFEHVANYVTENSMQDLIELLEEKLVGGEDRERNRATTLLAELFHHKKLSLHPSVLHLYVVFFCHRLSDYPSIIPSLHALTALVQLYGAEFDPKYCDALDMFQTIFRNIVVPTYAQTIRHKVLKLFRLLLANNDFVQALQLHSVDMLNGLISSTEEEKDPRCLLEVFSLLSVAFASFSTALTAEVVLTTTDDDGEETERTVQLAARAFESLSCYFPITFSPPPNDPFGITPQALSSSLEDCLCNHYPTPSQLTTGASASPSSKRKLHIDDMDVVDESSEGFDGNAMVRLSVGFLVEQLSGELVVGKVHALRALARIVRTNPLTHRVFALLPRGAEGIAETSNAAGGVSAQDSELFAMVEDGDEETDYANLHIQDARRTASAALTPQQRLTRELGNLQVTLYRLATDAAEAEGAIEVVAGALQLIGQISASIGTEFGVGGTSEDWQTFGAPILQKIAAELAEGLSSPKAKAVIDVAYVMARMGGEACCAVVLWELGTRLLSSVLATHAELQKEVHQAGQDAVRRVDRVLNLASINKMASVTSEDGRLAVGIEMLAQLIACVSTPSAGESIQASHSHDHSHSHSHGHGHSHAHQEGAGGCGGNHQHASGGCGGGHDHSHGHAHTHGGSCGQKPPGSGCCPQKPNGPPSVPSATGNCGALQNLREQLFMTLARFLDPTVVTIGEQVPGPAFTNPFLAVKSAFNEGAAVQQSESGDAQTGGTVFQVPAAAVLAVVASINAMKELLIRSDLTNMPANRVTRYIEDVTRVAIEGVAVLFPAADSSVLAVQSGVRTAATETLHRACVTFLVATSQASGGAYAEIVQHHAVERLLQTVRASPMSPSQAEVDARVFPLLSVLARASDKSLSAIVPALTQSVQDAFVADQHYRALLAISALSDILPPASGVPAGEDAARHNKRAVSLLGLDSSSDGSVSKNSAVVTVLLLVHGQIDVVLGTSRAAEVVETLYALVRRLSLCLTTVAAQSAQVSALIDAFLPAEAVQRAALSPAQVSFAIGLVANATACLDKTSKLFEDVSSSASGLALCVDYALQSVSTTSTESPALKVLTTGSLAEFGAAQLLAVVLNKARVESQCEAVLARVVATLLEMDSRQDLSAAPVYVQLLVWATRAVSMRSNLKLAAQVTPTAPSWQEYFAQRVVTLLTVDSTKPDSSSACTSAVRLQLASALHILTSDHEVVLSLALRPSATATSLFWKQKLWSRVFGPLSRSKAKTAADEADHTVVSQLPVLNLLAICALVTGMPTNILQDSMKDLVSIVVMAVSRSQSTITEVTDADTAGALAQQSLRTLETLLNHDAQLFVPYLNIIVPALMETSQRAGAARLRATALEALLTITEHVPYTRLYPFKALVSKGLQKTLDDKKKAVRVLAGRVRNKWIVMK